MSIENSFCLCDWQETTSTWSSSKDEEGFANTFFSAAHTTEIEFDERVHYSIASWELLEDFSNWYRNREFNASDDWEHFCHAWKQLGLMEIKDYEFGPVNELVNDPGESEIVFGALSPETVRGVLAHLQQINLPELDQFMIEHGLKADPPFSELVQAMMTKLEPTKGLVIFAG